MRVSSFFAHHGEEPPLSGARGSGTVFFSYCSLRCDFCQNYQISHDGHGTEISPVDLATEMLGLQTRACHNINLVTPTHYLPWILQALRLAAGEGLVIPVVYNCSGYEALPALALLRGIVDIYLPDMKYGEDAPAKSFSGAPSYVAVNRSAVAEMFRQVGPLRVDDRDVAERGLIIRHLVLPDDQAGSARILRFLVRNFHPDELHVSLMAQYRPLYRASRHPRINRRISREEYETVRDAFVEAGVNGYYQYHGELDTSYCIDFTKRKRDPLTGV